MADTKKGSQQDIIEKNRKKAAKVIKLYMDELLRPEKFSEAPINQIASALGTLVEKFGKLEREACDSKIIVNHNVPRAESEDEQQ